MIRRFAAGGVLRLFSAAVVDQAMLSAANLVLVLLLIRYAGPEQYGYFVLVQVGIALLVSAQSAWIGGPLVVLAPKRTAEQRDHMIATVNHGLNRFLLRALPLALAVPLLGLLAGWLGSELALLVAAGVLAAWQALRRDFSRRGLLIHATPRTLLAADALYVGCLLAGAGIAVVTPGPAAAWAVLALGFAACAGDFHARRALRLPKTTAAVAERAVWKEMRPLGTWATAGAVVYWVQSQSFNYALAALLTVAAVAHVNEARLMLMPVFLMFIGVSSQLTPSAARWLHEDGLPSLVRRLCKFVGVLLVLNLAYMLVLWLARDWITSELMNTVIPGRDLLLLLWACHALLGMTREMFQSALLVLERFRALAWLSALAAALALATMWICVERFGAAGAVMGTASGEVFFLIGMAVLLPQSLRRDRAQRAVAAPT